MKNLEILNNAPYTSIQDEGRHGYAQYAIPRSGVMDPKAMYAANEILGLPYESPVIEFNLVPSKIKFHDETKIALTGANMHFRINGQEVNNYVHIDINKGDVLSGQWASSGARAYLQVQGVLQSQKDYGSASTYPPGRLGFNNGRILKKGDVLYWKEKNSRPKAGIRIPDYNERRPIKIFPGPEFYMLDKECIKKLKHSQFEIDASSNRMAARLSTHLPSTKFKEMQSSKAILTGFIQLTSEGEVIIILQDGQTTGGYPRIAFIKDQDLAIFNQIRPMEKFRFELQQ